MTIQSIQNEKKLRKEWRESLSCPKIAFKDFSGYFVKSDAWTEEIANYWLDKIKQNQRAFGGCTKCYGKGYGTTLEYASSKYGDTQLPRMVFCSCERGKGLEHELQLRDKALLTSLIVEVGKLPQGEGILGALDSLTAKLKALDNE